MRNLLEILDKVSKEVSDTAIEKITNIDDLYTLCVEYGYSSTQDVFKIEYNDILEKSVELLKKSDISDNNLNLVSGGNSPRFASGVALALASIDAVSPSIGAVNHNNSSIVSAVTKNTKSVKYYDYLRDNAKSLLDKGKKNLDRGLKCASEYGKKFINYSSDATKKVTNFVKSHPISSSVAGTAGIGVGIYSINKLLRHHKKSSQDKNRSNTEIDNRFQNTYKFIESAFPVAEGRCDFLNLDVLEQQKLATLCLKELGFNYKPIEKLYGYELMISCIKYSYQAVNSENNIKLDSIKRSTPQTYNSIQQGLSKLVEIYKIQINQTSTNTNQQVTENSKSSKKSTVLVHFGDYEIEAEFSGNRVRVDNMFSGWRSVDENMNVILENEEKEKIKKIETSLIEGAKQAAEQKCKSKEKDWKNFKNYNKEITTGEKKFSKIENELESFQKELDELKNKLKNDSNANKIDHEKAIKETQEKITRKNTEREKLEVRINELKNKKEGVSKEAESYIKNLKIIEKIEDGTYEIKKDEVINEYKKQFENANPKEVEDLFSKKNKEMMEERTNKDVEFINSFKSKEEKEEEDYWNEDE